MTRFNDKKDKFSPLTADEWLDLLSNKYRRKIIQLCSVRPCYPQEISRLLKLTPRAVIKHLKELEDKNLVLTRDQDRPEGGRKIKYYYVPFKPRFDFNLSNKDLVDIEIIDESEKSVPPPHSRKKLLLREQFSEEEILLIKNNFKEIISNEQAKNEAFIKYKKLVRNQERFLRNFERKFDSDKRILIKIIKFLFDRYGFHKSFTHKDLETGLGIDIEAVDEIITLLTKDLNVISKSGEISDSSLPKFKLNMVENKHKFDYG